MLQNGTKVFENWIVENFIGAGSFGAVYKIKREEYGKVYYAAMKVINIPQDSNEHKKLRRESMDDASISSYYGQMALNFVKEIELLSSLDGVTNIVDYKDHLIEKNGNYGYTIYIKMQLLKPLSEKLVVNDSANFLPIKEIVKIGIDICTALELCEKHNIIHRDIKIDNVFISENGDYKLGDFGIAKQLESTRGDMSQKGTLSYMAPEIYHGDNYNQTVDVYSLGLLLYRLLNKNRAPFLPVYPEQITFSAKESANNLRLSGKNIPPIDNIPVELNSIILKACEFSPKKRYQSASDMKKDLSSLSDEVINEDQKIDSEEYYDIKHSNDDPIEKDDPTFAVDKENNIKKLEKEKAEKEKAEKEKAEKEKAEKERAEKEKAEKEKAEKEKAEKEKAEKERAEKERAEKERAEKEKAEKEKAEKEKAEKEAKKEAKKADALAKKETKKTENKTENKSKKKWVISIVIVVVVGIVASAIGIGLSQFDSSNTSNFSDTVICYNCGTDIDNAEGFQDGSVILCKECQSINDETHSEHESTTSNGKTNPNRGVFFCEACKFNHNAKYADCKRINSANKENQQNNNSQQSNNVGVNQETNTIKKLTCFDCKKSISYEESYIDGDEFYCQKCYENNNLTSCYDCGVTVFYWDAIQDGEEIYCYDCYLNNNSVTCYDCGTDISNQEVYPDGDQLYCQECFESNNMLSCTDCGIDIFYWEAFWDWDEAYCYECYENNNFTCYNCGTDIYYDEAYLIDDEFYCYDCYEIYDLTTCYNCGVDIYHDEYYLIGDEFYCYDCYELYTCFGCGIELLYNGDAYSYNDTDYCYDCYLYVSSSY